MSAARAEHSGWPEVGLESTTYPGTTDERLRPILESGSGLQAGEDFHLAFHPNASIPAPNQTAQNTPKVVGGPPLPARGVGLYGRRSNSRPRSGPPRRPNWPSY